MVHIVFLDNPSNNQKDNVHPSCRVQIAALIVNEVLISISIEYSNFVDVFPLELTSKLLKYTRINNHAIELVDD